MISMNCSPPRAIAISSAARFAAAKARMRNSPRLNIGSAIRVSARQNTTRSRDPPARPLRTQGFVQPVEWPP
jgi:hypothetical protein